MHVSDFDFPFDPSLIADRPIEPRDQARLLIVPRHGGCYEHRRVADLPEYLKAGDLLVVNDTKVMPVRLRGLKRPGGGAVDLVLIKEAANGMWEALLKGGGRCGQVIELAPGASATVVESSSSRTMVQLETSRPLSELLQEVGQMPLPPYIKRSPCEADRKWYQTVFARAEGAVAAPTAGLHFTDVLVASLKRKGVGLTTVTLHVGPATFRPVKVDRVEDHRMPAEAIDISGEAAAAIERTRAAGGRVVAVGTTVVRTLEGAVEEDSAVRPTKGESSLFILPGYQFRVINGLLTNFHLPRTTLLMLVSALTGVARLRDAYREAIQERYRFYSYGDAMLIL
jgi:S-adenosylmethionine:tRNA ribosyltransferase-isomerase